MKRVCVWLFLIVVLGMASLQRGMAQEILPESLTGAGYSAAYGLKGWISDSTKRGGIPLAHVFLIHGKDTVKRVADLSGCFSYQGKLPDTMQVQVSALGFKPFTGLYIPKQHGFGIRILLQQDAIELNEIIITGKRVLIAVKGDTLQYHTDMVKTLDGDLIGRILEKLPGVSMTGGLKVNGINIARVYVNGDSTMFKNTEALKYITADNVKKLEVYNERNKEDLAQGAKYGRREKVMNVITKNKVTPPSRTTRRNNSLQLGGGIDASRERSSKFSEKYMMRLDYKGDNTADGGRPSTKYLNIYNFSADYSNLYAQDQQEFGGEFNYNVRKKRGKMSYKTMNSYRNTTIYTNRWTLQDYFPTEQFNTRHYEESSADKHTHYSYKTKHTLDIKHFSIGGGYSYVADKRWQSNQVLSTLDDKVVNSIDMWNYNRNYTSQGYVSLGYSVKNWVRISARVHVLNGGRTGRQMDTLETSSRPIHLYRDWNKDVLAWRVGISKNKTWSLFRLGLSSAYECKEESSKGIGMDLLTDLIDTNNTRNYTYYTSSLNTKGSLNYMGEKITMEGKMMVAYNNRNRIERFPVREQVKDDFLSMEGSLTMEGEFSPTFNMRADYFFNTEQPSIEQLRAEIDDVNPLSLRAGNPNLKQTKNHRLQVLCNKIFVKQSVAWDLQLNFNLTQDPIISNSRFFLETQYLPEYDYTIEQGATLYAYENASLAYSLKVNTGFEKFWAFLGKCRFDVNYQRDKNPSYYQGEKNTYIRDIGRFAISVNTNFSKKVAFTILNTVNLARSASKLDQPSESFSESINLNARTNILKFSVNASFSYNHSKDFATGYKVNQTNLGASISRNVGKYISMSLNGSNLLDSKSSKNLSRTAEYFSQSVSSQIGRYIYMMLSYKF